MGSTRIKRRTRRTSFACTVTLASAPTVSLLTVPIPFSRYQFNYHRHNKLFKFFHSYTPHLIYKSFFLRSFFYLYSLLFASFACVSFVLLLTWILLCMSLFFMFSLIFHFLTISWYFFSYSTCSYIFQNLILTNLDKTSIKYMNLVWDVWELGIPLLCFNKEFNTFWNMQLESKILCQV